MNNFEMASAYMEFVLGEKGDRSPVDLGGWQVIESLWPLNEVFRPRVEAIRSMQYLARFEAEADSAIEAFIGAASAAVWNSISAEAWRVLLERHQQMLVVAAANEAVGSTVITLPRGLVGENRMHVLMLIYLHSMKLPRPPEDRSRLVLPEFGPPTSSRRH